MFSLKIQKCTKCKMQKKWRLFNATDFQSLMYPCFIFCRIFAIFPYKFNASIFEVSKAYYILSTMVVCICCACNLVFIYGLAISETITYGDVTRNLEVICYFILNSVIIIITHILSIPRMRLLQTILEISSKLSSESYQKLSRFIHVKDILGTILFIVQNNIFCFTNMPYKYEQDWRTTLLFIFATYISLLEFHTNMLYANCACILKACFKNINNNLLHMQQLIINDAKSYVSMSSCHMQRNQFLLIKLKTLKKQHLTISKTVQTLNIIFSLQLLATIAIVFTNTTFRLYSYIARWQHELLLIRFDWHILEAFFIYMAHFVIKLMLLVWICETCKNQFQETGTIIHDILNNTKDEQIKYELRLFSLQILHCENTFTAKGLTVDATLLTAMVGSITTYMLILIQFLITSHSCDGNSTINNTHIRN
ncbi:PREDICTED: uncharacterized protein LOC105568940 [Vollenhovia emeryi]|uniref:uncharacterized protein LOC105568940 n=1 Tax=Vollenhovia emeryi TaxID=411798 RepID=UPI0005F3D86C|nr:PREDICTED: uncharacterized protein LOC105568940 [Vollenhovia emeryi]